MRRAAAVVAVLALAGADASAKTAWPLYGIVGDRSALTLVELDPETLQRVPGRQLRLGAATSTAAVVRGGDLAFADGYRLRLIDLETMKPFGRVPIGGGDVRAVAWLDWRWVVVMHGGQGLVSFVAVDRSVMKVVRRTYVRGNLIAYERTATELMLLVAPQDGIGPARLVLVDERARTREVTLERIVAGTRWDGLDPPRGESRSPGLAVDPDGRTAYVVAADGLVAEVPLDGGPRYRAARGRYAKTVVGSWRRAQWLGGGVIAVVGSDSVDGRTSQPSGLELVDTRTWSSRRALADALDVRQWRDGALVTRPGVGVVAIGRDGSERFRLLAGEGVWIDALTATHAYVSTPRESYVLDLLGVRVSARLPGRMPWLLPTQQPALWP